MFWQHACLDITKYYSELILPWEKIRGLLWNQCQRQEKRGRTWIEWWFRSLLKWVKETVGVAPNAQIPFQKERRSERKSEKPNEQRILTPLEDTGPRCTAGSRAWCTSPPRPPSRSWRCASPHKRTSFCDAKHKEHTGSWKWKLKWVVATGWRRWHQDSSAAASWVNTLLLVSKREILKKKKS